MLPVVKFRREIPNMFDEFFGKSLLDESRCNSYSPSVNVLENKDNYIIEVAAPGLSKEDFRITLDNEVLTISSEQKQNEEMKNENYLRREFGYRSFKRSFGLPELVDGEKISASHKNGILTVNIPKKEEAKPKPAKEISVL